MSGQPNPGWDRPPHMYYPWNPYSFPGYMPYDPRQQLPMYSHASFMPTPQTPSMASAAEYNRTANLIQQHFAVQQQKNEDERLKNLFPSGQKYQCQWPRCKKVFSDAKACSHHIASAHDANHRFSHATPALIKPVGQEKKPRRGALTEDVKTIMEHNLKHPCPWDDCDKEFDDYWPMHGHVMRVHRGFPKGYTKARHQKFIVERFRQGPESKSESQDSPLDSSSKSKESKSKSDDKTQEQVSSGESKSPSESTTKSNSITKKSVSPDERPTSQRSSKDNDDKETAVSLVNHPPTVRMSPVVTVAKPVPSHRYESLVTELQKSTPLKSKPDSSSDNSSEPPSGPSSGQSGQFSSHPSANSSTDYVKHLNIPFLASQQMPFPHQQQEKQKEKQQNQQTKTQVSISTSLSSAQIPYKFSLPVSQPHMYYNPATMPGPPASNMWNLVPPYLYFQQNQAKPNLTKGSLTSSDYPSIDTKSSSLNQSHISNSSNSNQSEGKTS